MVRPCVHHVQCSFHLICILAATYHRISTSIRSSSHLTSRPKTLLQTTWVIRRPATFLVSLMRWCALMCSNHVWVSDAQLQLIPFHLRRLALFSRIVVKATTYGSPCHARVRIDELGCTEHVRLLSHLASSVDFFCS
jgi:hypothetical protein